MVINSVRVENFRCILDETLACDSLTALVGANGSGKSAFLKAIDLFYSTAPSLIAEDFYNEITTDNIKITIKFGDLTEEECTRFARYIQKDQLVVIRVFEMKDGRLTDRFHGLTLRNPEFGAIRKAGTAAEMRALYSELQTQPKYKDELPKWKKRDDADDALVKWEEAYPAECRYELDEGQFFGFKEVAQGYLGKNTRFLYVPAVRDAAQDSVEMRGSVITQLMDLVVRSVVENRPEVKSFRETVGQKYGEVFDSENLPEIRELSDVLSKTLRSYVPDSNVDLSWLPSSGFEIPMPKADVKLVEDGYTCAVERTGHGLQRAFIMSLLQNLAIAQATSEASRSQGVGASASKVKMPNLILGVEEPELYQHPNRQRHLASILWQLANGQIPGVADRTQVIYCTHSPLFVGLDRFNQIRVVRKVPSAAAMPKKSQVISRTLDEVAKLIGHLEAKQEGTFTGETLRPRLTALLDPWVSEGFFAPMLVLVEGDTDRAAILGTGKARKLELESIGVSVIPCGGKSNLFTAATIFQSFGTPTYCIWDSDGHLGETAGKCEKCGKALDTKGVPEENRRLLRLLGQVEEDWPGHIEEKSACFAHDLESTLRDEIGEEYFEKYLNVAKETFGIAKRKHALKNAMVISSILEQGKTEGKTSKSLESILDRILALHDQAVQHPA